MFAIVISEKQTLLLRDAKNVEVNEDKGYAKFYDSYGDLISLFKLSDIKGFHEMN